MPLRGRISECVTTGCRRIAGYSHVHCCTDCVQSGGRFHTSTCQRRQDLAYVVTGNDHHSAPEPCLAATGALSMAEMATSSDQMPAQSILMGDPGQDAAAASTESNPLYSTGAEAIEVLSEGSSEESSADFELISVTGGATAKMTGSASVITGSRNVPLSEAGSSLHMMD